MKASPDQVLAAAAGVAFTLGLGLLVLAYEAARYFTTPIDHKLAREAMRKELFFPDTTTQDRDD